MSSGRTSAPFSPAQYCSVVHGVGPAVYLDTLAQSHVQVIVEARKPSFFSHSNRLYEIVTEEGLMRPCPPGKRISSGVFCGGSAGVVQDAMQVQGDSILYVGDHIYTDNAMAKLNFRWRTCLIVREVEQV